MVLRNSKTTVFGLSFLNFEFDFSFYTTKNTLTFLFLNRNPYRPRSLSVLIVVTVVVTAVVAVVVVGNEVGNNEGTENSNTGVREMNS